MAGTTEPKSLAIRPDWRADRFSFMTSVQEPPDSARPTMEQSPLTQQVRPEILEPKVVGLYRKLFRVCNVLPFASVQN